MKKKLLVSLFGLLAVAFYAVAEITSSSTSNEFVLWYKSIIHDEVTIDDYVGDKDDLETAKAWQEVWSEKLDTRESGETTPIKSAAKTWVKEVVKSIYRLSSDPTTSKLSGYVNEITLTVAAIVEKDQVKQDAEDEAQAKAVASWKILTKVFDIPNLDNLTAQQYNDILKANPEEGKVRNDADQKTRVEKLMKAERGNSYNWAKLQNKLLDLQGYIEKAKEIMMGIALDINNMAFDDPQIVNVAALFNEWKSIMPGYNYNVKALQDKLDASLANKAKYEKAEKMKQEADELARRAAGRPASEVFKFVSTYAELDDVTVADVVIENEDNTDYALLIDMEKIRQELLKDADAKVKALATSKLSHLDVSVRDSYIAVAQNFTNARTYLKKAYVSKYANENDANFVPKSTIQNTNVRDTSAEYVYELNKIDMELKEKDWVGSATYVKKMFALADLLNKAKEQYIKYLQKDNEDRLFEEFTEKYNRYVEFVSETSSKVRKQADVYNSYEVGDVTVEETTDFTHETAYDSLKVYQDDIEGYWKQNWLTQNSSTVSTKVGNQGYEYTYATYYKDNDLNEEYPVTFRPANSDEKKTSGQKVQNRIKAALYQSSLNDALKAASVHKYARDIAAAYAASVVEKHYKTAITFKNAETRQTELKALTDVLDGIKKGNEVACVKATDWAAELGAIKLWNWGTTEKAPIKGAENEYGKKIGTEAATLIEIAYPELRNRKSVADWMVKYAFDNTETEIANMKLYYQVVELTKDGNTVSSDLLTTIKSALSDKAVSVIEANKSFYKNPNTAVQKFREVVGDADFDNIVTSKISYFSYVYGVKKNGDVDEEVVYNVADPDYNNKANMPTSWKVAVERLTKRPIVNEFNDTTYEAPANSYVYIEVSSMSASDKANAKNHANVIVNDGTNAVASHIDLNYTEPYYFKKNVKADEVAFRRTNSVKSNFVCQYLPFDVDAAQLEGLTAYYISGAKVENNEVRFGLSEKEGSDSKLFANKPYLVKANSAEINEITIKAEEGKTIEIKNSENEVAPVVTSISNGKIVYNFSASNKMEFGKDYKNAQNFDVIRYYWAAGAMQHIKATRPNYDSYIPASSLIIDQITNTGIEYVIGNFFVGDEDEATAIESVEDVENADIFTVSGVKVQNTNKAGLYIQNGKKVMVK